MSNSSADQTQICEPSFWRAVRGWTTAALVATASFATATGQVSFSIGTGSVTHAQRADGTGATRVPVSPNVNPFALPQYVSSTNQYVSSTHPSGNIVFGSATSSARAGLGHITGPAFFGVGISTGTNLTQRGNSDTSVNAASTLTLPFTALWTVGAGGIVVTSAGASMGLAGSVPSPALPAFTQINLMATFEYRLPTNELPPPLFQPLRTAINSATAPAVSGAFFLRTTAGTFTASPSNMVNMNLALPPDTTVRISGTMTLLVHNDGTEASLKFPGNPDTFEPILGVTFINLPPAPPPAVALTTPTCDGFAPQTVTLTSDARVRWLTFTTTTAATFTGFRYVDVGVETVAGTTAAVALGLYSADGGLVSVDRFSGRNRVFGQLSYGGSRRLPIETGAVDFDGRSGDLPAGTYYLAVAPFVSTFGANNFAVTGSPTTTTNDVRIRVNTNTLTGCPIVAAVAPSTPTDLGTIPQGLFSSLVPLDSTGVRWVRFVLTEPVGASTPLNFLTIDTAGTNGPDTMIGLYNEIGQRVSTAWFDDDSFGDSLSQLDFRQPSNSQPPVGPANVPLDGRNGNAIPAGTYYLAVSRYNTTFGFPGWRARAEAPLAGSVTVRFHTRPCRSDFNQDGFTDPDDLSDYIGAYFGLPPAMGSDFNNDGITDPDDLADFIGAFFGAC